MNAFLVGVLLFVCSSDYCSAFMYVCLCLNRERRAEGFLCGSAPVCLCVHLSEAVLTSDAIFSSVVSHPP